MGRNRTPTSILDAKGSFLTHKNRKRPDEPTSDRPLGSPPKSLSDAEKKVWKELAKQALPGVLFESDRLAFTLLVKLAAKLYANEPLTGTEMDKIITLTSKFAMNPADRSKVSVEKPKQSALSAFMAKRNGSNRDLEGHIQ